MKPTSAVVVVTLNGSALYAPRGRHPLACDAGRGFFYLDPEGSAFCCHLLPHQNLQGGPR